MAEGRLVAIVQMMSLASGFAAGEALVERFDGGGTVKVFYATFERKTAGMPFMATLLAPFQA